MKLKHRDIVVQNDADDERVNSYTFLWNHNQAVGMTWPDTKERGLAIYDAHMTGRGCGRVT